MTEECTTKNTKSTKGLNAGVAGFLCSRFRPGRVSMVRNGLSRMFVGRSLAWKNILKHQGSESFNTAKTNLGPARERLRPRNDGQRIRLTSMIEGVANASWKLARYVGLKSDLHENRRLREILWLYGTEPCARNSAPLAGKMIQAFVFLVFFVVEQLAVEK